MPMGMQTMISEDQGGIAAGLTDYLKRSEKN